MIRAAALLLQLGQAAGVRGAVVTDSFWSQALATRKQVVVYLPPSYARGPARRYPVAYYLHGRGGRESDWTAQGRLAQVMDSLVASGMREMIVVMPDGDDGWYTTWNTLPSFDDCVRHPPPTEPARTFCVPWPHYDDYVARDLVRFVDGRYRTRAERASRAVAGLDMGGYGALVLALQYPEVFGAAASHSGVLAPGERAPLRAIFGADPLAWRAHDPVYQLDRALSRRRPLPSLYADWGTRDTYAPGNRAFRDSLALRHVVLDARELPGEHAWEYWRAHVGESLAWIASRTAR
jgi:enterochelin esterase family protein